MALTQIMGEMFVDFGIQPTNWTSEVSALVQQALIDTPSPELSTKLVPSRPSLGPSALAWAGYVGLLVNAGAIFAYLLIRKADDWGRKRVLNLTIAGYITTTFLTGFAMNIWVFIILQFFGRIFLLAEWAIAMVMAAEEFPAGKRGTAIGILQGASTLGAIFCVGTVPFLLQTPWGWRSVYFAGIVPLVLIAWSRRNLRETERFKTAMAHQPQEVKKRRPLFAIWRSKYRGRLALLSAIWCLAYIPSQTSIHFWKLFAEAERGFTDGQVALAIGLAAVVSMPLVFLSGKLIDTIGRKRGATVIFLVSAFGVFGCYTFQSYWALTCALTFGIFGAAAFLPVLNAYTTELFPTEMRGDAFAWSNNLLGRLGYVFAPGIVGVVAVQFGAFGPIVRWLSLFSIAAMLLILFTLPETKGKELEDTAMLH